jgi:hypothetical protein
VDRVLERRPAVSVVPLIDLGSALQERRDRFDSALSSGDVQRGEEIAPGGGRLATTWQASGEEDGGTRDQASCCHGVKLGSARGEDMSDS